jgi:hypothetical protein
MARSRNDLIRRRIGKAILTGNLTSTGRATASSPATLYDYDSNGALLTQVDSASLVDGSLHYLSKLRQMYVWDDSDGQFFQLSSLSADSALGSTYIAPISYSFQGSVSGYTSGGDTAPSTYANAIDKFPFATDANATDVGDLTLARANTAGQSSETNGYTSGGKWPGNPSINTVDKFLFATDGDATDVGDLTKASAQNAGQSSETNGYNSSGLTLPGSSADNLIDKFPFATDANATDVGDVTSSRQFATGNSSSVSGYTSGGFFSNTIDKFPFATDANATDVGDLTSNRSGPGGQSSSVSGYTSGGETPSTNQSNIIEKFPFATDANATDVGDLIGGIRYPAGQSSTVSGYISGGEKQNSPFIIRSQEIEKFSFATDANATDVGNIGLYVRGPAGQQV